MQISITDAKARLSALIAAVERGGEVIITRWGRQVVRLVAFRPPHTATGAGAGNDVREGDSDIINVRQTSRRKED
jgi:prevent-host-death family protein